MRDGVGLCDWISRLESRFYVEVGIDFRIGVRVEFWNRDRGQFLRTDLKPYPKN